MRWQQVLERLVATTPGIVVPGHGDIGGAQVLTEVAAHLRELRAETWRRLDSAMGEAEIRAEVRALLLDRHPDWSGREWIDPGVSCLCSEHGLYRSEAGRPSNGDTEKAS